MESPLLGGDLERASNSVYTNSAENGFLTTKRSTKRFGVKLAALVLTLCVACAVVLVFASVGHMTHGFPLSSILSIFHGATPAAVPAASFAGYPGTGLDLATGQGRLPFVSLATETKECRVDDGANIKISTSLDCKQMRGKVFPERRAYVFTSYRDYDSQVNQWRSSGSGVGGFFVWTDDVRQIYRDYFAADLAVAVTQQEHAFVELSMNSDYPAEKRTLTDKAAAAVKTLEGKDVTPESRQEFVRNYGTSYVSSVKMGGIAELRVFLKKDVFLKMSSEDVRNQVQKDFERELKVDTSHVLDENYVHNRVGKSIMLWGGSPDVDMSTKALDDWLATVPGNPAALQFVSEEMNPLVEEPAKPAIRSTVDGYLDLWGACRSRGCLSHGVCDVAGKCQCDNGFSGTSCEVIRKTRGEYKKVDLDVTTPFPIAANWMMGDVNGDGRDDLITLDGANKKIDIALALGDSVFKMIRANNIAPSPLPAMQALFDCNGDKNDDIVGIAEDGTVVTVLSHGDGTFEYKYSAKGIAQAPRSGKWTSRTLTPHMVTASADGTQIVSYIPQSDGTISTVSSTLPANTFPVAKAVSGDFNKDGAMDFFAWDEGKGRLVTLFGIGNGTFVPHFQVAPHSGFSSTFLVGDINNDSMDDIISLDRPSIVSFVSMGDGKYDIHTYPDEGFTETTDPSDCVVGDFDNDGNSDIRCTDKKTGLSTHTAYSNGDTKFQWIHKDVTVAPNVVGIDGKRLIPGYFNGRTNAYGSVYVRAVEGKQTIVALV